MQNYENEMPRMNLGSKYYPICRFMLTEISYMLMCLKIFTLNLNGLLNQVNVQYKKTK